MIRSDGYFPAEVALRPALCGNMAATIQAGTG